MTTHKTGTREQWLKARLELLKAERKSRGAATRWQASAKSVDVLDRDSNSRALMRLGLQFKSDTNSPGYMHVPNCAWTAT